MNQRKTIRVGDKVFYPKNPEWLYEITNVYLSGGTKRYNIKYLKSPNLHYIGQPEFNLRLSRDKKSAYYVEFYSTGHPLTKIFQ